MFRRHHFGTSLPLADMNPIVKAFIVSEIFFWSGWNFVLPIISIFVIEQIPGANIQTAATAFTAHLIIRIITELIISGRISNASNTKRVYLDCIGMFILTIAYLGIAAFHTIESLYIFYMVAGLGFGIASPAKLSLFSKNLEKNHESNSWGIYDALVLIGMAISTSVGGFIANQFGFKALFLTAGAVNLLGILPYVILTLNKNLNSDKINS